jgi:hypothetical protein
MRLPTILALTLTMLSAEPREALLIGNSNYQYISTLNNPKADLKRLKRTLEDLHFTVKIKTNLNSENLEEAIDIFAKRLARNRSTTGFLYYTGHGCQVERQGYLLPINVDSTKRIKVKHNALKIDEMIETLKESGNRVNMFFLDACRDVPVGTKGSSKGLGQIKNTPKGTLVVYATKDGETAEDNSDFINSIISSVKEPQQSIRNLPYSISDVFKRGSTTQTPIFLALDIPKVVLNTRGGYVPPKPIVVPVEPVPAPKPISTSKWITPTKERVTWKKAKELCSANGGRLPTLEELKKVVTDCGGEMKDDNIAEWERNRKNASYHNCYKKRGFNSNNYWSSTSLVDLSDSALIFNFYNGYQDYSHKTGKYYVRGVRAGQ